MVMSERLAATVIHHGVLYPGRAQYATFQISTNMHIGILNIYRFSDLGPRAILWNHLAQVELPDAQWILTWDFNNIEHSRDKQGGSSKTSINHREMEAWNRLLVRLGVRDAFRIRPFRKLSEKAFTWSNGHNDNTMI